MKKAPGKHTAVKWSSLQEPLSFNKRWELEARWQQLLILVKEEAPVPFPSAAKTMVIIALVPGQALGWELPRCFPGISSWSPWSLVSGLQHPCCALHNVAPLLVLLFHLGCCVSLVTLGTIWGENVSLSCMLILSREVQAQNGFGGIACRLHWSHNDNWHLRRAACRTLHRTLRVVV